MLEYKINKNDITTETVVIPLRNIKINNFPSSTRNYNQRVIIFEYDKENNLKVNDKINVKYNFIINNDNDLNSSIYTFNNSYRIIGVNKENKSFSILDDRYLYLDLYNITINNDIWYFSFGSNNHFFEKNENIIISIEYNAYIDNNIERRVVDIECEYVTPNELSCSYKEEMNLLKQSIINDNGTESNITTLSVYRENILYTQVNNTTVYINNPLYKINFKIADIFDTTLNKNDIINNVFVKEEEANSINPIVDMEKDVYHPVIWDTEKDDYVDSINKEVDKIIFNLHFRQRNDTEWTTTPDSVWNGCYKTINNTTQKEEIRLYNNGFFSYGIENCSSQSDLLTYLGFSNSDVRYQKNKLSKSFIRLLFYDSTNPGNQNLLYYSTIFVNSGELFGKYIKHVEDTPFISINQDGTINQNLVGIKVDREPDGELIDNKDKIEDFRLSSQFVVQDKYQSLSSSDGFYFYNWRSGRSVLPTDLYMKIEFNHAGFGRTIPFMIPFWERDKQGDEKKGIKTFQEIIDDWNDENTMYNARRYLKYSYIRWKYKYDKKHGRYIYYLDDTFYGTDPYSGGVHFNNNTITLNLYEAKMI